MLGIFDSGTGGHNALSVVRKYVRYEDIILFTDRQNAPYGTKSRSKILGITKENIEILRKLGARKVLIACCTASTLFPYLTDKERQFACDSLTPTVDRVKKTGAKRVTLLATDRTVREGAFKGMLPECTVTEIPAQPLVGLIDGGARDGNISRECRKYLRSIIPRIKDTHPELIILGCTHFHSLKKTIEGALDTPAISSAYEGVMAFLKDIKDELREESRTLRLS